MAKNVTTLTVETLQSLDGTENVVMFDSAEGKRSTLSTLSDYAVRKHKTTGMTQTIYEQGETLKQEITELKAAVGTPLVANTASAMTDQTKIYVYTGSETGYSQGHWYYWNGSAWKDGGIYQATAVETDKTLTLSDKPADSKTVGDALATKATPTQVDTKISENIDSTLSVSGQSADAKATGDSLKAKAESEGTVSMAKALVGGKYTLDQSPYHYRQSPDAGALDEKIVGGTLGWNQAVTQAMQTETKNGITFTKNGDGTWTVNGTATADALKAMSVGFYPPENHVVLACGCPSGGSDSTYYLDTGRAQHDTGNGLIAKTQSTLPVRLVIKEGATANNLKFVPQAIDLTTLFGSTIADYIYSLEQSSAGAGVDWVRQYIDIDAYHEYCEPTLKSVEGLQSRDVVGFNQWDEEWESGYVSLATGRNENNASYCRSKNYVPILPNMQYYYKNDNDSSNRVLFYDADENYLGQNSAYTSNSDLFTTPSNAYYLRFYWSGTTHNHDICINLSDPSRNGQYKPYEKHSYPLDSSVELRGIPKLSDGKMYFDGDEYQSDGQVKRRSQQRAYQSGDESLADAITDGTNTVVKLATPTTETTQPYQSPQLVGATEEYVTTGVVPVGHESRYYEDITGKVNNLPSDFSTLIAPVEKSFTATRNYTVGSFVIVNNQLYKVKSAISSGGTITPNSNVTATTIMAEILALA